MKKRFVALAVVALAVIGVFGGLFRFPIVGASSPASLLPSSSTNPAFRGEASNASTAYVSAGNATTAFNNIYYSYVQSSGESGYTQYGNTSSNGKYADAAERFTFNLASVSSSPLNLSFRIHCYFSYTGGDSASGKLCLYGNASWNLWGSVSGSWAWYNKSIPYTTNIVYNSSWVEFGIYASNHYQTGDSNAGVQVTVNYACVVVSYSQMAYPKYVVWQMPLWVDAYTSTASQWYQWDYPLYPYLNDYSASASGNGGCLYANYSGQVEGSFKFIQTTYSQAATYYLYMYAKFSCNSSNYNPNGGLSCTVNLYNASDSGADSGGTLLWTLSANSTVNNTVFAWYSTNVTSTYSTMTKVNHACIYTNATSLPYGHYVAGHYDNTFSISRMYILDKGSTYVPNLNSEESSLWSTLSDLGKNSSFPFVTEGETSVTNLYDSEWLTGAEVYLTTGNSTALQAANSVCVWLNQTSNKADLWATYNTTSGWQSTPIAPDTAANELILLAEFANIYTQWKTPSSGGSESLLQQVVNTFIRYYIPRTTSRVYSGVYLNGTDEASDTYTFANYQCSAISTLTLCATVLGNNTVKNIAYNMITNYTLGSTNLPPNEIVRSTGLPAWTQAQGGGCKEDEDFSEYLAAIEGYYHYYPNDTSIFSRGQSVAFASQYMWSSNHWEYITNVTSGTAFGGYSSGETVHGASMCDECLLDAYLIWGNYTWLQRATTDYCYNFINDGNGIGFLTYSGVSGLIAHSTTGIVGDEAELGWDCHAPRTGAIFANYFNNATYMEAADNFYFNTSIKQIRTYGFAGNIYCSNYTDIQGSTRASILYTLLFVNKTSIYPITTFAKMVNTFGLPVIGLTPPFATTISPSSTSLDVGQTQTLTSTCLGGLSPYSYQWYLNGSAISGATFSAWNFTPASAGYYQVYLNVTDSAGVTAISNIASVTVKTAVFDVAKTIVGQGYSLNVTFMASVGSYTGTFNVTLYANTTAIATQTATLASGNFIAITFTWNTAGFAYGSYTVSANVTLVTGETNIWIGQFTYGTIKVTIPGDINGDGKVNLQDLTLITGNWLQKVPPAPANADILNVGVINLRDLTVVTGHWLRHTP